MYVMLSDNGPARTMLTRLGIKAQKVVGGTYMFAWVTEEQYKKLLPHTLGLDDGFSMAVCSTNLLFL